MKKTFKNSVLLFVGLMILSCTNEKNFVNEKDHHLKISDKSFDELSKMPSFTTAFEKIPRKAKSTSLLSDSRSAIEEEFDFEFSDKPAKVIEADEKTSYTFLINRTEKDSTFFENLIIEINKQLKARAAIAKYIPSKPLVIEHENKVGFEGEIISKKLFDEINPNAGDYMVPFCVEVTYSLCSGDPYDCGGSICGFGTYNSCVWVPSGGGSGSGGSGGSGSGGGGGSGSGSGPSSSNNPPNNLNNINTIIVPPAQWDDALWKAFKNDLSPEQSQFLSGSISNVYVLNALETKVKAYLRLNEYSEESCEFMSWAITYLDNNPNTTWEMFENQFMGTTEGSDGDYDAAYWDNPNLTFPAQNLPTWANFQNAFPLDSNPLFDTPQKMYNSIGGTVATLYSGPNTNTCAIRMSKALNYSGVIIPNIPGQTFKGADNKYYFKAAYQINLWMRKTFGTNPSSTSNPITPYNANHHQYSQSQAGVHGVNLPALLNGKHGIYSIYSSNFNWATGHADLLNSNSTCGNHCLFYEAPILRLDVWELN